MQESPPSRRAARGYLSFQNYQQALVEFLKLYRLDSNNVEYNHSIGLCYLETYIDRAKSTKYLEWVVRQKKYNIQAWYDLGRAYAVNYDFDRAIEAFETYARLSANDDNRIPARRWIEMCENAKILFKNPLDVDFINLGPNINSEAPDFNPYIDANENFLIFTTKRSGNTGNLLDFDGYYTADIMYSQMQSGTWQKARRFSNNINTAIVEESVGCTPDGTHLFVYMENFTAIADVYFTKKSSRSFEELQPLGENLNTKYLETSACMNSDGSVLFITANYPDSYGGTDIYYSIKMPNGKWSFPVNAGNVINTPYDEEFPYIAPDGKTFFFASTGHNSMGGFDIFRSIIDWNSLTFTKPENIGYPINTPDNNYVISFTRSMRYAFISAYRSDSYGDLDIYKVIFKNVPSKQILLTGVIKNTDLTPFFISYKSKYDELIHLLQQIKDKPKDQQLAVKVKIDEFLNGAFDENEVLIEVFEASKQERLFLVRPLRSNSKFNIYLEPGNYTIKVSSDGYVSKELIINIPELELFKFETELQVVMDKKTSR